ncbi:hypothetical protein SLS63_010653 [Diaporthe eres]|uniref:3-dehydrosphinganine reductase n=1 Tax=Diaporthe eres TaxID=83184 RepID=A0ABR1NW89_DIAER
MPSNAFPVEGRTILIAGGSKGTGLEAGRQLAAKGGNIILVARDAQRLRDGIEYVEAGVTQKHATGAATGTQQRFHTITADLTSAEACGGVIAQATEWNGGSPPDVVWCFAGTAHPSLFIDTDPAQLQAQMDANYFTNAYMAHAALRSWLRTDTGGSGKDQAGAASAGELEAAKKNSGGSPAARHLIFTSSFVGLYSIVGYTPYSPAKAALRNLSDSLSQELELYAAANPHAPPVKVHTIFPATIFTEAYEAENKIKTDVTKMLEEGDEGQTPQEIARKSIVGLEGGQELIATDFLTRIVLSTMTGASKRGGVLHAFADLLLGCLGVLIVVYARWDMDRKVRAWGKRHGDSGMKTQ